MKLKRFKSPKSIPLILGLLILILAIFFFNFSFAEVPNIPVKITPGSAEDLKTKLSNLPMAVTYGISEAPCYQVRPGCEFWADRGEGGFPGGYQFSEREEFCMFNWCLSWEPVPSTLEFTGEEITTLLNEVLTSAVPFTDPQIIFEGDLIKASAVIKKPTEGTLYVEGYLERQDEFSINFNLTRAQFNKLALKGAALDLVETEINRYFNSQLSHLAGFRIDELEILDSKLRFVGSFPNLGGEFRTM